MAKTEKVASPTSGYQKGGPKAGTKAAQIIEFLNNTTTGAAHEGVTATDLLTTLFKKDPVYSVKDKDAARRSVHATLISLTNAGFIRKVARGRFARVGRAKKTS